MTEKPVEFTVPLKDKAVMEDETAILECEVNKENIQVTWWVGDKKISPDDKHYNIKVDGMKQTLEVVECTLQDTGKVKATYEEATTECTLRVEGMYTV